tara:strand:- start:4450 stop:5565 length:1116 start_codon:yes stop_codon:yes gene_type:complete
MTSNYKLVLLGIRGIPAKHGGFETFAEALSKHLIKRNWTVIVYVQEKGSGPTYFTRWENIDRVHIPIDKDGPLGTIIFDFKSIVHSLRHHGLFLTLGYNTAVFNLLHRVMTKTNIINMDGIEWRRDKWGPIAKTWFWLNERAGCWFGNHLVADHPEIQKHLSSRVNIKKITMIPYGGDEVLVANPSLLSVYGLQPDGYSVIIARPEPENSFLEMVRAFSCKRRDHKLVVLGSFEPSINSFHKDVMDAASEEVIFPGAIYEAPVVQALRFFARFYLHGHRVGGTNPSLVEALGAGCAVIAHDNHFNKWVAGPDAAYFGTEQECSLLFDELLSDDDAVHAMKAASISRFNERFTWEKILGEYEELLIKWYPSN